METQKGRRVVTWKNSNGRTHVQPVDIYVMHLFALSDYGFQISMNSPHKCINTYIYINVFLLNLFIFFTKFIKYILNRIILENNLKIKKKEIKTVINLFKVVIRTYRKINGKISGKLLEIWWRIIKYYEFKKYQNKCFNFFTNITNYFLQ